MGARRARRGVNSANFIARVFWATVACSFCSLMKGSPTPLLTDSNSLPTSAIYSLPVRANLRRWGSRNALCFHVVCDDPRLGMTLGIFHCDWNPPAVISVCAMHKHGLPTPQPPAQLGPPRVPPVAGSSVVASPCSWPAAGCEPPRDPSPLGTPAPRRAATVDCNNGRTASIFSYKHVRPRRDLAYSRVLVGLLRKGCIGRARLDIRSATKVEGMDCFDVSNGSGHGLPVFTNHPARHYRSIPDK